MGLLLIARCSGLGRSGSPMRVVRAFVQYHCADGVLEDELLLIIGVEHHGVLVERANPPGQLHTTEQINGDRSFFFACCVQEGVLYVLLCRLRVHMPIFPFAQRMLCSQNGAAAKSRGGANPSTIRLRTLIFNPSAI